MLVASQGLLGCSDLATASDPTKAGDPLLDVPRASPLGPGRSRHTSTLLADGTVLVVGGQGTPDGPPALASAERYVSAGVGLEPVATLAVARRAHTATRLLDGNVLIAGGFDETGSALDSAVLYLPDTRDFVPTNGPMREARGEHTATLLRDGRILLVGGATSISLSEPSPGAELFDPSRGVFSSPDRGPLHEYGRNAALTLGDGTVLIVAADSLEKELFDPSTNRFRVASIELPSDLGALLGATRLGDGTLALLGRESFARVGSVESCDYGLTLCGDTCVDLANSPDPGAECGQCGQRCREDRLCRNGRCTCGELTTCLREEVCVDVENDPRNCGECGRSCSAAEFCVVGVCESCEDWNYELCGSLCTDTTRDPANCGGCGNVCTTSCIDGRCAPSCGVGQDPCFDGGNWTCTDLHDDATNCRSCGNVCAGGRICWAGQCVLPPSDDATRGTPRAVARAADYFFITDDSLAYQLAEDDAAIWSTRTSGPPLFWEEPPLEFGGPGHTATTLPDGSVLTIGGEGTPWATRLHLDWRPEELRIRSPLDQHAPETFRLATALLPTGHTLFAFNDRAGIGFYDYDGVDLSSVGRISMSGDAFAVAPQSTGRLIVLGGGAGPSAPSADTFTNPRAYLYDPVTNTGSEFDSVPSVTLTVGGHALTLPDGSVLVSGRAGLERVSATNDRTALRVERVPRRLDCARPSLARLPNGRILVVGNDAFHEFDTRSGVLLPPVDTQMPRCATLVVVRPDGRALAIGGYDDSAGPPLTDSATAELYDPVERSTANVPYPLGVLVQGFAPASIFHWFDQPLVFKNGLARRLESDIVDPTIAGSYPTFRTTPVERAVRLLADGSIFVQDFRNEAVNEAVLGVRLSKGAPTGLTRFSFGPAPSLRMNTDVEFPEEAFPGTAPEGSSGTTTSSPTNLPIPIWFPAEGGWPAVGTLRKVGPSTIYRVPSTAFPGLGLLFLSANGELTGFGPMVIAPTPDGGTCRQQGECENGFCVDGVCCESACDGACVACSMSAGGSEDGACGGVALGTVDDACERQPRNTCGRDGTCDGEGQCASYAAGTECGSGRVCLDRSCVADPDTGDAGAGGGGPDPDEDGCDGDKTLVQGNLARDCTPYRCPRGADHCANPCSSNRDCVGGFVCTASGRCESPMNVTRIESCGCRLPGGSGSRALDWIAALAALGALRQRRTCGRTSCRPLP